MIVNNHFETAPLRLWGGEDMARARPAEGELGSMTRSVAERVIYEANLGAEDTKIARMYYIERLPQIEIAAEMQMDRKTISERLRWINRQMKTVWQETDRERAGNGR